MFRIRNSCHMRNKVVKSRLALLLVGVFLTLPVCVSWANTPQVEAADEDQVMLRAQKRWAALMDERYEDAYAFLSPGFRAKVSIYKYRNRYAGRTDWNSSTIKSVECEQDICEVVVDAEYRFKGVPPFPAYDGKQTFTEKWLKLDGEWWHVPRK